ncbi:hypothetical protein VP01_4g5 [Puccinia sorghi]|uniref:Uncharacterized protein n=1 Tax=Puccinia sorghi TaxID=27349 RepID=A0A0L6UMG5_9BASI|nr:hypothetical protein VP01_4g5 [Puccinia sorghi]
MCAGLLASRLLVDDPPPLPISLLESRLDFFFFLWNDHTVSFFFFVWFGKGISASFLIVSRYATLIQSGPPPKKRPTAPLCSPRARVVTVYIPLPLPRINPDYVPNLRSFFQGPPAIIIYLWRLQACLKKIKKNICHRKVSKLGYGFGFLRKRCGLFQEIGGLVDYNSLVPLGIKLNAKQHPSSGRFFRVSLLLDFPVVSLLHLDTHWSTPLFLKARRSPTASHLHTAYLFPNQNELSVYTATVSSRRKIQPASFLVDTMASSFFISRSYFKSAGPMFLINMFLNKREVFACMTVCLIKNLNLLKVLECGYHISSCAVSSLTTFLDLCQARGVDLKFPKVKSAAALLDLSTSWATLCLFCMVADAGDPSYITLGQMTDSISCTRSCSLRPHWVLASRFSCLIVLEVFCFSGSMSAFHLSVHPAI